MAAELINTTAWTNFMKVRGIFPALKMVYRIKSVLLSNIEGKSGRFDPGGRTMEIPFETDPNASYGNIGETEPFPEPNSPTAIIGQASMKTAAARFRFTERSVLSARGNEKSWAEVKMHNMANLVAMFAQHQSRELLCQWGPAAYARVKSFVAGTKVLTLYADQETGGGQTKGGKVILKGQRFTNHTGALTDANPDGTSDMQVTVPPTISSPNAMTVQGDLGDLANADYLILGSKERPSMNRAMIGLPGALDDNTLLSTYLTLSRATYGFLNAKVQRNVGAADLDKVIQTQMDTIWQETEAEIDMLLTTVGVRRAYFDQHVPELRYVTAAETGKFKGNFSFLAFQSPSNSNAVLPIDIERDCQAGFLYGLNFGTFYFGELQAPGWFQPRMTGGADDIFINVPEYAAWDAVYRTHREFICTAPHMNFVLQGITEG